MCASVQACTCLSVCMYVCLSVCLSVCACICICDYIYGCVHVLDSKQSAGCRCRRSALISMKHTLTLTGDCVDCVLLGIPYLTRCPLMSGKLLLYLYCSHHHHNYYLLVSLSISALLTVFLFNPPPEHLLSHQLILSFY